MRKRSAPPTAPWAVGALHTSETLNPKQASAQRSNLSARASRTEAEPRLHNESEGLGG